MLCYNGHLPVSFSPHIANIIGQKVITFEHGFAFTGALAMVAGKLVTVPLDINSATLGIMTRFAFPGIFHNKYKYDAVFLATVQQTAMILTMGLLTLVDLQTLISVLLTAVWAMTWKLAILKFQLQQ